MLELDVWTVVFQTVNFLILAALLYRLLFKPAMETIRKRTEERDRLMRELERDRQSVAVRRAELDERLSRMDEEAANMLALARERAEEEHVELLQQSTAEVEQILVEAQADAYRVRRQAIETFHTDLVDAILEVSGIVIRNTLPPEVHDALVRQLSERIWELGRTDIARVDTFRGTLGDREPTAHVTTARAMTLDQQGLMARTFTALADRHVNMEVRVDDSLVAGIRVRIGDIIMDSSMAGQMDELRDQAVERLKERIADE
jgi:F0F1-type ATP synthase membrane subunit b/b'